MYLFQPTQHISMCLSGENLHSTMYLFQRMTASIRFSAADIYIPLCIYFNHIAPGIRVLLNIFTFHYVSISTTTPLTDDVGEFIYIPLCIYFNSLRVSAIEISSYIYIPLCIYFNYVVCLYRNADIIIYIPLCIYFNLTSFRAKNSLKSIYIPLCIYFNRHPPIL